MVTALSIYANFFFLLGMLHPQFSAFSYGVRGGQTIIDLDITRKHLAVALNIVTEICKLGGSILVVGTRPSVSKFNYAISKRWIGAYHIFLFHFCVISHDFTCSHLVNFFSGKNL